MKVFDKQPSEVLDYDIDFSDWLTVGDNIIGASATPEAGITVDNTTVMDDRVKVWLSGGVSGTTYKVTVRINTEDGRTKEVDFKVKVRDK